MSRHHRKTSYRLRNQRGAALVEFALVAMLLFTLLLGIVDFSLTLKSYLALSQAAREGARSYALGALPADVKSKTVTWATTKLGLTNFTTSNVILDPATPPASGAQVKVELTYTHNLIAGKLFTPIIGSDHLVLRTSMVMRKE